MSLNSYEDIVTNFGSPTIVLAGPGTGKTYLLADRTKRLLDNGTDKNSITVLAFGVDDYNSYDILLDVTHSF
jgi:superfamily I DNA/RNA helicase